MFSGRTERKNDFKRVKTYKRFIDEVIKYIATCSLLTEKQEHWPKQTIPCSFGHSGNYKGMNVARANISVPIINR